MRYAPLICLALLSSCRPATAAEGITLYRDAYGVPSAVADKLEDGLYALGYAQVQDHAVRIAQTYKFARGRNAEVAGRASMLQDGIIRSLGLEAEAEKYAAKMPAEQRVLMDAFLAGENKALSEQKSNLPAWVEPFTIVDVLSLAQLANIVFPLQGMQGQLGLGVGSNQFALAPSKTSTHHPILSLDPHLGLDGGDGIVWQEFGLYAGGVNFRGIAIPGIPLGVAGHSDRIAWSVTNNDPALCTVYNVTVNPNNAKQYSYHGQWRDFESQSIVLKYLDNGTLHSFTQSVKRTAWGPMIPLTNKAVRFTPIGNFSVLEEALNMMRAKNVDEFREAMRPCGLSMWNYVAADVDGNIAYQYNARLPHRDESVNWRAPVDGSAANTAWSDQSWTVDELPHAKNPASGILVNANSAPWLTTLGDEISKLWPPDVTSYGHTARYDRLAELLTDARRVSPEKAMSIATDTQIPDALAATQRLILYADGKSDEVRAIKKWNGRADPDSVGAALYIYWLRENPTNAALAKAATAGNAWTADQTAQAVKTLASAGAKLKANLGSVDVPWGKVLRLVRGDKQVGSGGYGYIVGSSSAVRPTTGPFQKEGWMRANFGSSTRMIVSLEPGGVKSWSVLSYGNSDDPKSPHFADQMELYANGKYKPDAFGPEAVKKAAKETIKLQR